ncbi:MAG: SCO7613 C-terminal domain-containing membrane protein [Motilibacteraceae bacterium]
MIDERLLTDPTRCPACTAHLVPGRADCPECHVALRGPLPEQVWTASVAAATALERRARLVEQLRAAARVPAGAAAPFAASPMAPPPPTTTGPFQPPVAPTPPAPRAPKPEWTRARVQNVLLSLGVLLLAVAALVFLAVSWSLIGVWGRGAVMAAATLAAGTGAVVAARRGLRATGEAVAVLTVALALVDVVAVRLVDLLGAGDVAVLRYAAAGIAAVAVLTAAAGAASARLLERPLAGWTWSAALLAQPPLLLLGADAAGRADTPALPLAVATTLLVLLDAGAAVLLAARGAHAARPAALLGALAAGFAAPALALDVVVGLDEQLTVLAGAALLLGLAAVAAGGTLAALRGAASRGLAAVLSGTAAVPVWAAAAVVAIRVGPEGWVAPVLAAATLALLLAAALLAPVQADAEGWRRAPSPVLLAGAAALGLMVVPALAVTVLGPFSWAGAVWEGSTGTAARAMLLAGGDAGTVHAGWALPVTVLLLAAAAGVALRTLRAPTAVRAAVLPAALGLTLPCLAPAAGLALAWALVLDVALALAVLAVAALARVVPALRRPDVVPPAALATGGAFLLARATAWSLADQPATLLVVAVALAVAVVGTQLVHGAVRAGVAGVATALACAETAAVAAALGHPSPVVGAALSVAGALLAAAALLWIRVASEDRDAMVLTAVAGTAGVGWLVGTLVAADGLLELNSLDRLHGPVLTALVAGALAAAVAAGALRPAPAVAASGAGAAALGLLAVVVGTGWRGGSALQAAAAAGTAATLLALGALLGPEPGRRALALRPALLGVGVAGWVVALLAALSTDVDGRAATPELVLLLALGLVATGLALAAPATALAALPARHTWPAAAGTLPVLAVALAVAAGELTNPTGGWEQERSLLLGVVVAAVLAPAGTWLLPRTGRPGLPAEAAAAAAGALALVGTAGDAHTLWVALLAAGVGAAAVAAHPDRRRLAPVAALALLASSWVRLALAGVTAPEAYTVPAAVLLLAAGELGRRHAPGTGSWRSYGPGLALGLVPSLLAAVGVGGGWRLLLLGAAALVVLLLGARGRLQAPVVLGGGVLAVLAVDLVFPYVVAGFALSPWIPLGLAGALLLFVGATYERRRRDLQRAVHALSALR